MKNKLGATASGARMFIQSQIDGTRLISVAGIYPSVAATNAAIMARGVEGILGVVDTIPGDSDANTIGILASMGDDGVIMPGVLLSIIGCKTDMEKVAEAERRGAAIAELLGLRPRGDSKDRYNTAWGDKTALGLYWTLARFFSDRELPPV